MFREEALAYYARGPEEGSVLRLDSRWSRFAYWLICITFLAAALLTAVVPLHRYVAGPAVLRAAGRIEVPAVEGGTITAIKVTPGHRVEKGQLLIELDSQRQRNELSRVTRELELLQARLLRSPADTEVRAALLGLRAQRELALSQLQARQVVAPRGGRILDVHLRLGQHLQAGDVVASLSDPDSFIVVGLLPGHARPALSPGTTLRLELEGYRYRYLEVPIKTVSSEIVGPEAARLQLGPQVADSLRLEGPLALVEAPLPGSRFTYDGVSFNFFDGMHATVEVRTRTESALLLLIPGLREVLRHVR